jgi:deazaflavin-dependent oxidoreductase (nitroreductase family)
MSQEKTGLIHFVPYPQGFVRYLVRAPMLLLALGMGRLLRPMNLLVLTTRGRKSGEARHTVLEYRRHGSKLYIVSVWGKRPDWLTNLLEEPRVTVQLGQKEIAAKASLVTDSAEALRALYMFQRTGYIYEMILANMSSADSIDLRTLKKVAGEFTVVRLDMAVGKPNLQGIQPAAPFIGTAIITSTALLILWAMWMIWTRLSNGNESLDG